MKEAIDYTHHVNEGQGAALGCPDQSLYAWKNKKQ